MFEWYNFYVTGPLWLFISFVLCILYERIFSNKTHDKLRLELIVVAVAWCVVFVIGCVDFKETAFESSQRIDIPEGQIEIIKSGVDAEDLFDMHYNGKTGEITYPPTRKVTHTRIVLHLNENVLSVHTIGITHSKNGRTTHVNTQIMRPANGVIPLMVHDELLIAFNTDFYTRTHVLYRHEL